MGLCGCLDVYLICFQLLSLCLPLLQTLHLPQFPFQFQYLLVQRITDSRHRLYNRGGGGNQLLKLVSDQLEAGLGLTDGKEPTSDVSAELEWPRAAAATLNDRYGGITGCRGYCRT